MKKFLLTGLIASALLAVAFILRAADQPGSNSDLLKTWTKLDLARVMPATQSRLHLIGEIPTRGSAQSSELLYPVEARVCPDGGVIVKTGMKFIYFHDTHHCEMKIDSAQCTPLLVDCSAYPAAVLIKNGLTENALPGKLVRFVPSDDSLSMLPVSEDNIPDDTRQAMLPAMRFPFVQPHDPAISAKNIKRWNLGDGTTLYLNKSKRTVPYVKRAVSGQAVADFPEMDDTVALDSDLQAVKQFRRSTMLAGFGRAPEAPDRLLLVRSTLHRGSRIWHTTTRPVDITSLRAALPKIFAGAALVTPVQPGAQAELWQDGSILYPIEFMATNGANRLFCKGIALQPQDGPSQWLIWEAYHTVWDKTTLLHPSAKSPAGQIWYADANGRIVSQTIGSNPDAWARELHFTTDSNHRTVFFTRNNQLWAMEL